ncbi:hypothetical protein BC940DRAFT_302521 [Gongronella butleri]|nr:hypothetical protein BC940DRAFT_302521 [Gongronella butleri]
MDQDVCQDYINGLCVYDVFESTTHDMGRCPKHHGEGARKILEEYRDESLPGHIENLQKALTNRDHLVAKNVSIAHASKFDPAIKDKMDKAQIALEREFLNNDKITPDRILKHIKSMEQLYKQASAHQQDQFVEVCNQCACIVPSDEEARQAHAGTKVHVAYLMIEQHLANIQKSATDQQQHSCPPV